MEFTQEFLDRYVGGQLEVQNPIEGYLMRGEIREITLKAPASSAQLAVEFSWFAKLNGGTWEVADTTTFTISLELYGVANAGEGRLFLVSRITGERVVLFPPDGSKLDPSQVVGLTSA